MQNVLLAEFISPFDSSRVHLGHVAVCTKKVREWEPITGKGRDSQKLLTWLKLIPDYSWYKQATFSLGVGGSSREGRQFLMACQRTPESRFRERS